MLKVEQVYREILFRAMEKGKRSFTQKELAERLGISLTNVNHAVKPLRKMNAISVRNMGFGLVNPRKVLFFWASVRNLEKEIVYKTRSPLSVKDIEKSMPADVCFTAFSGYRLKFMDAPADYSEVYVYASAAGLNEIEKRFSAAKNGPFNVFVLEKDENMERYGKTATIANLFADLWNLPQWYAADYLKALEARINGLLE